MSATPKVVRLPIRSPPLLPCLAFSSMCSLGLTAALLSTTAFISWWALALTLGQASAMLACARDRRFGWLAGLALQAPWLAYDVVTRQYAFIATAVICSVAQVSAIRRLSRRDPRVLRSATGLSHRAHRRATA